MTQRRQRTLQEPPKTQQPKQLQQECLLVQHASNGAMLLVERIQHERGSQGTQATGPHVGRMAVITLVSAARAAMMALAWAARLQQQRASAHCAPARARKLSPLSCPKRC